MGVLAKEQRPVSILELKKNSPVWVPTKIFSYSTLPDNQFWTIFRFQNK